MEKKINYWGEITLDEMIYLNNLSKEIGWRNAVSYLLDKDTQESLLNEQRADWKYLTGTNTESRVLDIGCGFGAIACAISKSSKIIYALEPVWERIRFVDTRIKQEGIKNIRPICADALYLPFSNNSFDLVILNGVLEWVGYLAGDIKPNIAQEQVLKEISRVIKPNGVVYVGIENRFAFIYFLGIKDPHTGLPFINLMPRHLANLYHLIVKKKNYSTYLYSYFGYSNLLRKAGFKKIRFYTPLPSYRKFSYIFPLDNIDTIMNFWLDKLLYPRLQCNLNMKIFFLILKFILNTPLRHIFKYFTLDYSIIASKETLPSNIFQDIISKCNTGVDTVKVKKSVFYLFYYKSWRKRILFYFRNRDVYPSYVWRIADNPVSEERLKNAYNITLQLYDRIADVIPKILYNGYINNEYCMLQSMKEAIPLTRYLLMFKNAPKKIDSIFSQIGNFLIKFHTKFSTSAKLDNNNIIFKDIIYKNFKIFSQRVLLDSNEYCYLHQYIEDKISSGKISHPPFVVQHGDFQPSNILYSDDNNKFTIIDWEYCLKDGLPLIDLLHFLFFSAVYIIPRKVKSKQRLFFPLFSYVLLTDLIDREIFDYCFYQQNTMSDLIYKHIDIYCNALNINHELRQLLFLMYIFQNLSYKKDFISIFLEKGSPINL